MKPAARNAFVVVVVLVLAATTSRAPGAVRELLAHGTDQYFWSADVTSAAAGEAAGVKTTIRFRTAGDQLRWRTASELAAMPVSLGHRGGELLVALESGEWKIVSEGGVRSGNPLPDGFRVLALAGDGDDIWAVAAPRADAPTTATTAAATTAPAARGLTLFRLQRGEWKSIQPLPANLRADRLDAISLMMLDGRLMLAAAAEDRAIRTYVRSGESWQGGDEVAILPADGHMKLLSARGRTALWVAEPGSPGVLHLGGERWGPPVKLKPSEKLRAFDRRTIAGALGNLRLLASDGKGRLAEQVYGLDGEPMGEASEAVMSPTPMQNQVSRVIQIVVMSLLLLWMMMAVRQRPNVVEAVKRLETLGLAPLGRRLIGGLIDMLPLLIAIVMGLRAAARRTEAPQGMVFESAEFAWMSAGLLVYFLHIIVMELIFARSIGKLVTGTRVASLDGSRPGPLAVLTRNVLRIVDVALLFVPLLAVLGPLRQRVGDMGAGTVVVMNSTPIPPASEPVPPARDDTGRGT